MKQCPDCFGWGSICNPDIDDFEHGGPSMIRCPRCNGMGKINLKKRARHTQREKVEVKEGK